MRRLAAASTLVAVSEKRRLPVLREAESPDELRPPWQWVVIGAAMLLSLWVPASMLAEVVVRAAVGDGAPSREPSAPRSWVLALGIVLGVRLLAFVGAAVGAGAIVGRFGGRAGVREAAAAGALAAAVGVAMAAPSLPLAQAALALGVSVLVGAGAAALGGTLGLRRRPRPG